MNEPYGSRVLLATLSTFINADFHPIIPAHPQHIVVASGVTALLDLLSFAIVDEGDAILIGRPLYTGFRNDLRVRSKVKLVPVSAGDIDPMGEVMGQCFEEEIERQREQGVSVRGMILVKYAPPPIPRLQAKG